MTEKIEDFLLSATREEFDTPKKQVVWLKENYDIKVSNEKELIEYLEGHDFLKLAANYLEVMNLRGVKVKDTTELLEFVKLDYQVNFMSLIAIWKIKDATFKLLKEVGVKTKLSHLEDATKALEKLTEEQQEKIRLIQGLPKHMYEGYVIHIENLGYLNRELYTDKGTLYAMKDNNLFYRSMHDYIYNCTTHLMSKADSAEYKSNITKCLRDAGTAEVYEDYKKLFPFELLEGGVKHGRE